MTQPHTFVIDGRPHPKERPRTGQGGHTYTPKRTKDAEAAIKDAYDGPMFDGLVRVNMHFSPRCTIVTIDEHDAPPSTLRGDVDNYAKTVLDALNGFAWVDDRLVMAITAVKL